MNNRLGIFGAVEDEEDMIKTYGPECVFNGGFDDDENWEIIFDWLISGGVAAFGGSDTAHLRQKDINMILPMKVNTNYMASFDVVSLDVDKFLFSVMAYMIAEDHQYIEYEFHETGHYERFFRTGNDLYGGGVRIEANCLGVPPGGLGTLDNFSIKECLWK